MVMRQNLFSSTWSDVCLLDQNMFCYECRVSDDNGDAICRLQRGWSGHRTDTTVHKKWPRFPPILKTKHFVSNPMRNDAAL